MVVLSALSFGGFILLRQGIDRHDQTTLVLGALTGGAPWIALAAILSVAQLSRGGIGIFGRRERFAERVVALRTAELERRNREAMLINDLSDLLQSCYTISEAGQVVGQLSDRLFPNASGALYVYAASRNELEVVARWGGQSEAFFGPDDCWALRRGHRQVVVRGDIGPSCAHAVAAASEYVCVPMLAQGETVGLFHVWRTKDQVASTQADSARELQLTSTVSEHVSLAIANLQLREKLRNQSIRDPLTGLFNRRYMEESLDRELHRAARHDLPIGILMVDIDHFKDFNDRFGHESGDLALCKVADCLASGLRGEDIACRYGGEEFVLVLPGASGENSRKRAEDFAASIRNLRVLPTTGSAAQTVTISVGVSAYPDDGSDTKDLVRAADVALYRAKATGRDRVVLSNGEPH
ncbi:MAG: GGDEF domain-containing protein [Acidimicrobiales bacterium]